MQTGDVITNVTFAGIDNDSDCSNDGYANYSNLIANVQAGTTNEISVTVGNGWTNESVSVWIDYNANFIFEENEFTYIGTGSGSAVTGRIDVPEEIENGIYRMRVRVAAVGAPTATWDMACDEEQVYGETEDYAINVGELSANDFNITNFKYYPNPVEDILNISSEVKISNISIHDLSGKQLYTQIINNKKAKIHLSHLTAGIYVVKINLNAETKTFKIVKK